MTTPTFMMIVVYFWEEGGGGLHVPLYIFLVSVSSSDLLYTGFLLLDYTSSSKSIYKIISRK